MAAMSLTSLITFFIATLLFCSFHTTESSHKYATRLSPKKLGLRSEKLTHIHFYLYEKLSGSDANAVRVAEAPTSNQTATLFGIVSVQDEPMLVNPDKKSKLIGRAQGIVAFASQENFSLVMAVNFAFMEGAYNGSTVTMLGRNLIFDEVREMPVVGGSGVFRFARGYVHVSTYQRDTGDGAILEYNMYLLHY